MAGCFEVEALEVFAAGFLAAGFLAAGSRFFGAGPRFFGAGSGAADSSTGGPDDRSWRFGAIAVVGGGVCWRFSCVRSISVGVSCGRGAAGLA